VTLKTTLPDEAEREALTALGAMFSDPICLRLADRELAERLALDAFVLYHRAKQRDQVGDLAQRFGEGPALRKARKRLDEGELLDGRDLSWLSSEAERDGKARAAQEHLREDYLGWREGRAQRLAKAQGIAGRLRNGPETFLDQVDRRALRFCRSCDEIAYPDPEWARYERGARYDVAGRCHFCGARALGKIETPVDAGGEP
jgi:hypothetical protein